MKKNKFKLFFIIIVIFLLLAVIFSPSVYEEAKKSSLLPGTQNHNFYGCYLFYTVETRLYNNSKYTKTFYSVTKNNTIPDIGFCGGIKIEYHNSSYFYLRAVFISEINNSLRYIKTQYFNYNSSVGKLFFPGMALNQGKIIIYSNGTSGTVTNKNYPYNDKMFSSEGIIKTVNIEVHNIKYNRHVVKSCFSYASTPSGGNILTSIAFSGKLYPFTEIFPAYNNSEELILSLNRTNVNLEPLDLWLYYIAPNIIDAVIIIVFAIPVYAFTVISAKRRR